MNKQISADGNCNPGRDKKPRTDFTGHKRTLIMRIATLPRPKRAVQSTFVSHPVLMGGRTEPSHFAGR